MRSLANYISIIFANEMNQLFIDIISWHKLTPWISDSGEVTYTYTHYRGLSFASSRHYHWTIIICADS